MPYATNAALPASVRHHLPTRAQDIYRKTFNEVWATHAENPRREEMAHRIAWAAVKRQFHKGGGGQWQQGAAPIWRAS